MKTFDYTKEFKFKSQYLKQFLVEMQEAGYFVLLGVFNDSVTVYKDNSNKKELPFPREWRRGGKTFAEVKDYIITKYNE